MRPSCQAIATLALLAGEITGIQHDAAIVCARRPFVPVILVRGRNDSKQGSGLAADITRELYHASQSGAQP